MDNNQHNKINGEDYRKLIITAAQYLEDNKEEINELNVFPVPDGDTGSNMSMTVAKAAEELLKQGDNMALDEAADKTAKAMLHGARGNSGVIISLLFRGIAKGLINSNEADGVAWANALKYGVEAAYKAVDRPAEGTILTVARCCAEAAERAAKEENNFEYVLQAVIEAGSKALANTVNQNPVLEKAGVVDAGGKGWLLVLQAMLDALNADGIKLELKPVITAEPKAKADFSSFDTEEITFGFCTEFIVRKYIEDSDSSELKSYLNTMGDSLVMIDDGEIIKVHVHTNEPHQVLGEALKYGVYETVKVENMRTQHTNKLVEQAPKALKKYGFVSVSNGEGMDAIFEELGVDKIVSGGQTMNPATEDLCAAVEAVDAETVFILPNNKNIIMTAKQVAELVDKNVIVIPTRSVPQGFSAMLGYNEDVDATENEQAMTETSLGVDTMQITYAARNSNFDDMDISEGDYLAILNDKLLSADKDLTKMFVELVNRIKESSKSIVSIYYGADVSDEEAEKTAEFFRKELGNGVDISLYNGAQPVYFYIISAE
ncbi:MAG: DAK2 domain-containing protein [Clostridia bacterium]|nr:DAK2 domain-containing protein [Clostridia bacterium]